MVLSENNFNEEMAILRAKHLQQDWELVAVDMEQDEWCTPEYYAWIMQDNYSKLPSREGELVSLEDAWEALWER